ncbi:MAG TPA: sigma-E factor negative regulatory protein [Candidatus Competibacteraceae bacterium]|nr:sigma-E factor negative regulatory protein [Candidatus Competibacteraceae bacterium]
MVDKTGEQLSALVDGECKAHELELALRRLAKDEELKARWQRYHLVSDALKSHLPVAVDPEFSTRIQRLIEAEPSLQGVVPTVESGLPPSPPAKAPGRSAWGKFLIGVGLAASVALVSALVLRQSPQPEPVAPVASHDATPVGPVLASGRPLPVEHGNPLEADWEAKLNQYLVNHNEYASRNGMQGVLPYVRMVGYETSR